MGSSKKLVREKFRNAVFERDSHKCVFCSCTENLDAHHITDRSAMHNGGYVKENGVSLCPTHHMMAEKFHISGGTEWEPGMHPDDLYAKIGSNHERAVKASERLG